VSILAVVRLMTRMARIPATTLSESVNMSTTASVE